MVTNKVAAGSDEKFVQSRPLLHFNRGYLLLRWHRTGKRGAGDGSRQAVARSVPSRSYKSDSGTSFTIDVIHTDRDASAYATLTLLAKNDQKLDVGKIGVASLDSPERILFYQGANLVQFQWSGNQTHEAILNAARLFAATLPAGDDDFPVLVKHLPIGSTSAHPSYAV